MKSWEKKSWNWKTKWIQIYGRDCEFLIKSLHKEYDGVWLPRFSDSSLRGRFEGPYSTETIFRDLKVKKTKKKT